MQKNSNKELIVIALKLLAICAIVAAIVAFVNSVTKDKIAHNELVNTAEALNGIYSQEYDGNRFDISDKSDSSSFVMRDENNTTVAVCDIASAELLNDVTALYIIKDPSGNTDSYCVAVSPMGFKDKINMLVAVNTNITVKGVKIVSLSETSGIGTKVAEPDFLSRFENINSPVSSKVDTISGATKSSKPVINAVETALTQVAKYINANGGVAQ